VVLLRAPQQQLWVTQFDYSLLKRGVTAENEKSEDISTMDRFGVKINYCVIDI